MYKVDKNLQNKIASIGKIDFLATIDDDVTPHITVLGSLMLYKFDTLIWGQFCEGISKKNLKVRPENTFLVMTPEKEIIRGSSVWREAKKTGPEIEMINNSPYFRYNSYYSLAYVHYMDLLGIDMVSKIDFNAVDSSRKITLGALEKLAPNNAPAAMNILTMQLFSKPDSIKILAFITDEGSLKIVPIFQAIPAIQGNRILFSMDLYADELTAIPKGAVVAVYCISQTGVKYSVMVKGIFNYHTVNSKELGVINVDKVYNPMMPKNDYIYPVQPLMPVKKFKGAIDV